MNSSAEVEPGAVVALMNRAQQGDRVAFEELRAIGESRGVSFTEGWSSHRLLFRLQDRASTKNLLARTAVAEDLADFAADLSARSDGPIERLIVQRAALYAVEAGLADLEHLWSIENVGDEARVEAFDRRRERAHRRLLSTLKALAEVRRTNRAAVQVNIGDGNVNVLRG